MRARKRVQDLVSRGVNSLPTRVHDQRESLTEIGRYDAGGGYPVIGKNGHPLGETPLRKKNISI